jgi:myosin heavy subunit
MAENEPHSNARNGTIDMAEGHAIGRAPLRDVNGNNASATCSKLAEIKKLEGLLAVERKRSKSALKDLALAETKREKLLDLLDERGLEVVQLKSGKTGAVAEVNLLKKLHKTELKSEKELTKKEILAKSVTIKTLKSTKKSLKKELNKVNKQYETLGKLHSNLVERNSELSATHVAVLRVKADLISSSKSQAKEVKRLTRLVDNQQEKKLKHEFDMQEMRVTVKQLALEETRERSSKASAAPRTSKTKSLAMGLDEKKELATHNALLKKQSKENDDARAALKKELKKKETQSNLGFAAGMVQQNSNLNGGMWQSSSVAEVSR